MSRSQSANSDSLRATPQQRLIALLNETAAATPSMPSSVSADQLRQLQIAGEIGCELIEEVQRITDAYDNEKVRSAQLEATVEALTRQLSMATAHSSSSASDRELIVADFLRGELDAQSYSGDVLRDVPLFRRQLIGERRTNAMTIASMKDAVHSLTAHNNEVKDQLEQVDRIKQLLVDENAQLRQRVHTLTAENERAQDAKRMIERVRLESKQNAMRLESTVDELKRSEAELQSQVKTLQAHVKSSQPSPTQQYSPLSTPFRFESQTPSSSATQSPRASPRLTPFESKLSPIALDKLPANHAINEENIHVWTRSSHATQQIPYVTVSPLELHLRGLHPDTRRLVKPMSALANGENSSTRSVHSLRSHSSIKDFSTCRRCLSSLLSILPPHTRSTDELATISTMRSSQVDEYLSRSIALIQSEAESDENDISDQEFAVASASMEQTTPLDKDFDYDKRAAHNERRSFERASQWLAPLLTVLIAETLGIHKTQLTLCM